MIISALLMTAIISDVSSGMRPDIYVRPSPTSLVKSSASFHERFRRLCKTTLSIADGRVIDERQTTLGVHPLRELRWSTAGSTVWTLQTYREELGGIVPYNADVESLRQRDFERADRGDCASRLLVKQRIRAPRNVEANRRWSRPIFGQIANWAEKDEPLRGSLQSGGRLLQPYHRLLRELLHARGREMNGAYVPYNSIAAVDATTAVVAMYFCGTIAFVELNVEPGEKEDARTDRIFRWKSLGVADTKLSSWASSFWSDDAMHLVSDDGRYESFKLEGGKMVPLTSSVESLAPDALYCDGTAVWIVSKNEDGQLQSVKIPFKIAGEPKAEKRQWPKGMSIDEAVLDLAKE